MSLFYFDTSALLKRYKTENGTDILDAVFSGRGPNELFIISHFTIVEVESAAARALQGHLLSKKAHRVLLNLFVNDLGDFLIVLPVSTALLSEAAEVARRYHLRAADALQLATALSAKRASSAEIVFVASDKELIEAAQGAGFSVLDPENNDALILLRNFRERPDSDDNQ